MAHIRCYVRGHFHAGRRNLHPARHVARHGFSWSPWSTTRCLRKKIACQASPHTERHRRTHTFIFIFARPWQHSHSAIVRDWQVCCRHSHVRMERPGSCLFSAFVMAARHAGLRCSRKGRSGIYSYPSALVHHAPSRAPARRRRGGQRKGSRRDVDSRTRPGPRRTQIVGR